MRRRTSRTPRPVEPRSMTERTARAEAARTSGRLDRSPAPAAGLGPYEAEYDVSLGYCSERSITVQ